MAAYSFSDSLRSKLTLTGMQGLRPCAFFFAIGISCESECLFVVSVDYAVRI